MTVLAHPQYAITDLGFLPGGAVSVARAINRLGWVVGEAEVEGGFHAFVYSPEATWLLGLSAPGMVDLGTLGGANSFARAIDAFGQVVGSAQTVGGAVHAFLWPRGGPLRDLGTLGGQNSAATAVVSVQRGNAVHTQVVGWSETRTGAVHAFLAEGGMMQDLGPLGGIGSAAVGINALAQISGETRTTRGDHRAVRHHGGESEDLGTLGGASSRAAAINAAGQVVGLADTPTAVHAFLASRSIMQDLGTLGGRNSAATAINAAGQVVGLAHTAAGAANAFLYDAAMVNLNTLLPPEADWELAAATGINDAGQIVGYGLHGEDTRGFLLTPVSR